MKTQKVNVLIVGVTGKLGSLIAKHCLLQENLIVSIFIQDPTKGVDLCKEVLAKGGNVIVGDVTLRHTVHGSTKGIHTIISCLFGDDETVLDGQKALLKDGKANGVVRFMPSDFSIDYRNVKSNEHPILAQSIAFRKILQEEQIKGIHIFNGILMEDFLEQFIKIEGQDQLGCWQSGDIEIDLTTYEDTSKFVAAIVSDIDASGDFEIVGQVVTMNQIAELYGRISGKNINLKVLGTYEELVQSRDSCKTQKSYVQDYINRVTLIPLIDGRGKLHNPVHQKYGIKPVQIEDFLHSTIDKIK